MMRCLSFWPLGLAPGDNAKEFTVLQKADIGPSSDGPRCWVCHFCTLVAVSVVTTPLATRLASRPHCDWHAELSVSRLGHPGKCSDFSSVSNVLFMHVYCVNRRRFPLPYIGLVSPLFLYRTFARYILFIELYISAHSFSCQEIL
jgi:hypothetical protein